MAKAVAVVGGGLQGSLAAIACARRGWDVVLFERRTRILQGASRNNEGKIHLGFTYGLDAAGETQRLLARYGAAFRPALRQLLDTPAEPFVLARAVTYARHADSMLSEDATVRHLETLARLQGASGGPAPYARRLAEGERREQFGSTITSAHIVAEETIDPRKLCAAVADAVSQISAIQVKTGVEISHAERGRALSVFAVGGQGLGAFDAVVNCAWEGLPEFDRRSGLPSAGYCLRGKAGFIARAVGSVPSEPVTFCFGPFGDIVPLSDDLVYLSWYPSCLMGFTTNLADGASWFAGLQSRFDYASAYSTAAGVFEKLCPGLRLAVNFEAALSGPILAAGGTDIDDLASGLHQRTRVGIRRQGALFSVNTGKLTLAPQLALELAELLAP